MELAAVIVCGGRSRRMGVDKATMRVHGERLLERVATRIAAVADPVLIAPGRAGRYGPLPWDEVDDVVGDGGPAAGLAAALVALPDGLVAAVAVDLPQASPTLLVDLARRWAGEAVVVPVADGHDQWLHAVWSTGAAPELVAGLRAGRRSFAELTSKLAVARVEVVDTAFAVNLNRPEDLAGLGQPAAPDRRPRPAGEAGPDRRASGPAPSG